MVEQRPFKALVAGSSPAQPTVLQRKVDAKEAFGLSRETVAAGIYDMVSEYPVLPSVDGGFIRHSVAFFSDTLSPTSC